MILVRNLSETNINLYSRDLPRCSYTVKPQQEALLKGLSWGMLEQVYEHVKEGTLSMTVPDDSPLKLFSSREAIVLQPVPTMEGLVKLNKSSLKGGERVTVISGKNKTPEKYIWTGNKFVEFKDYTQDPEGFNIIGALRKDVTPLSTVDGRALVVSKDSIEYKPVIVPEVVSCDFIGESSVYLKTPGGLELILPKKDGVYHTEACVVIQGEDFKCTQTTLKFTCSYHRGTLVSKDGDLQTVNDFKSGISISIEPVGYNIRVIFSNTLASKFRCSVTAKVISLF